MKRQLSQEELEYRRRVYRLKKRQERRRQRMIARGIAAAILILLAVILVSLVRLGIRAIKGDKQTAVKPDIVTVSTEPTADPLDYSIPEGDEEYAAQLEKMRKKYPEVEDILMNLYEYPESLLKLVTTNPETITFLLEYPKHKADIKSGGQITAEELKNAVNGIPALQQWDSRWGYLHYGNDIIAIDGCGPTCMSMVVSGLTKDLSKTPDAIAEFSVENNYCTPASGTAWSMMSSGARKLGLNADTLSVNEDSLREALENGHPVICSMKPGDFTTSGHFIVLSGVSEDGQITLNDPNSIKRSETTWDFATLLPQIKAAWSYSLP